ncbi:hypothetical protein [Burkholderia oklahomensis]|uniref:Uncharacterized protein n=1 Tax=Burkholderia oklahomensis TaxID=342113 RepID=A0AAI8BEM9_9BURK|nr:hypothetical protein [Burkholderia oklahomensis]AIO70877.1 hypothetical protein DM82_6215 [Burkholderia oklahomensis]AJX35668.1 hypothetical protein BG90_4450 [Burkholderia oklahomensis C6786]AOI38494.1 hypothetical protein WG70_01880 [Burkholderia oklahomensis EO147]AOI48212.1 hypothetical protein WI23_20190 [Burkholderia oklahomensis C6786]KUY48385.1 hypothetical protein WG70_01780 [Burkholderia oklahomensis EO147]
MSYQDAYTESGHLAFGRDEAAPAAASERAARTQPAASADRADALLALARKAGMLVTLDGQIGRERYQSVAGSLASLMRFASALEQSLLDGDR